MTVASILRRLPPVDERVSRGVEILALKRRAWREHGNLVVSPNDPALDQFERNLIERIGTRLYGPSPKLQAKFSTPTERQIA